MLYSDIETNIAGSLRRQINIALLAGTVCLGALGAACFFTTLSGAVVAPGKLIVAGRAKQVQHPDGGIIKEIKVDEGQKVQAGQVLFTLDGTLAAANLRIVEGQLAQLLADEARLWAESTRAAQIDFPPELAQLDPERAPRLIEGQKALTTSRIAARDARKSQLREQVVQVQNQITALEAQKAAAAESISLIERQLNTSTDLRARNLLVDSQLNAVQRERAALLGSRSAIAASIAEAAQRSSDAQIAISLVDEQFDEAVQTELSKTRNELARLRQEHVTVQDKLRRLEIRAPFAGYLHEMGVHTPGGVIQAGERLVSIIPADDRLVVEAHVTPADVEQVYSGQPAQLKMTGLNTRVVSELAASVLDVSPDLIVDPHTGVSYYNARLEISPQALTELGPIELRPGMPLEAYISTTERPVIDYLLEPITEQLRRAMRES